MKAPDKIYVCIPQRLNLSTFNEDSKYVGMAYTDKGNLTSPQIEEYILKDALLEWIQEARAIPHENAITRDLAFQEVINKLNSM